MPMHVPPGQQDIRRNRRLRAMGQLPLVLLVAAGCGDGTVPAQGRVLVEGQPASGGRLSLIPIGDGQRAYSLVDEQGAFALRTKDGAKGAFPGSYRASLIRPANEQDVAGLPKELPPHELSVSYQGSSANPVVIPADGAEELVIDIRSDQGWTRRLIE